MTSGDLIADRRVGYARALSSDGDHGAAASLLEQARELVPDWPEVHFLLGEALSSAGRRDDAVAAYTRYLALADSDRHGALPRLALLGAAPPPSALPTTYVQALFDDYAPRFDRALMVGLDYRGPELVAAALDAVAPVPGALGTVLDLGCGTGLVGERLRLRAAWLEGVDLSPTMAEAARRKGIYDAVRVGDLIDDLPRVERLYDVVVAADVLNYLGDLEPFFAAVNHAVAPDGLLAITAEAAADPGPDYLLHSGLRFAHTETYLRRKAEWSGFAVRHAETVGLRAEAGVLVESHVMVFERRQHAAAALAALPPGADPAAAGPAPCLPAPAD